MIIILIFPAPGRVMQARGAGPAGHSDDVHGAGYTVLAQDRCATPSALTA